jgi:hypothetical protein
MSIFELFDGKPLYDPACFRHLVGSLVFSSYHSSGSPMEFILLGVFPLNHLITEVSSKEDIEPPITLMGLSHQD